MLYAGRRGVVHDDEGAASLFQAGQSGNADQAGLMSTS